jgi:hypothetical protein
VTLNEALLIPIEVIKPHGTIRPGYTIVAPYGMGYDYPTIVA